MRKDLFIILGCLGFTFLVVFGLIGAGAYWFMTAQPVAPTQPMELTEIIEDEIPPVQPPLPNPKPQAPTSNKPVVVTRIIEKSDAEKAAEEADVLYQKAFTLFREMKYRESKQAFDRGENRIGRFQDDLIEDVPATEWREVRQNKYKQMLQEEVAKRIKEIRNADFLLHEYNELLSTFRHHSYQNIMEPLQRHLREHMADFGKNRIMVTCTTRNEKFLPVLAQAMKAKFPEESQYRLTFYHEIRQRISNPWKQMRVTLTERPAKYPGQTRRRYFYLPQTVVLQFRTYGDYKIKTSWDKLPSISAKIEVPFNIEKNMQTQKLVDEYQDKLNKALAAKLEQFPKFQLFPDVNIDTLQLVDSRGRVDLTNARIMAALDKKRLAQELARLLPNASSTNAIVSICRAVIQNDVKDHTQWVSKNMNKLTGFALRSVYNDLRDNPGVGDYELLLSLIGTPRGLGAVEIACRHQMKNKRLFEAIKNSCLDPENPNRNRYVALFLSYVPAEQRLEFAPWILDKDKQFALASLNAISGRHFATTEKLINQYYSKVPSDLQAKMWERLAGVRYYEREDFDGKILRLNIDVVKSTKDQTLQSHALNPIRSSTRKASIWLQLVRLRPHIISDADRKACDNSLVYNIPAGNPVEGNRLLFTVIDEQTKARSTYKGRKSYVFNTDRLRGQAVSQLFRINKNHGKTLSYLRGKVEEYPKDNRLLNHAIMSIQSNAHQRNLNLEDKRIDSLIGLGVHSTDRGTRNATYDLLIIGMKKGIDKHRKMLEEAAKTEKDPYTKKRIDRALETRVRR